MRICKHCGVRVEQIQVNGGLAWMHVVRSVYEMRYRACKLDYVAEPMGDTA